MCNCDCCPKREVVSNEKLSQALDSVLLAYPTVRMNWGALVSLMMREINPPLKDWKRAEESIGTYLHAESKGGKITMIRGPRGGITRNAPIGNVNPIHTSSSNAVGAVPIQSSSVVNNHICPSCGNDRVNKDERSCWKCGGAL